MNTISLSNSKTRPKLKKSKTMVLHHPKESLETERLASDRDFFDKPISIEEIQPRLI